MPLRIYLTGRLCIEYAERVLGENAFAGNQDRLAWAFLVIERDRSVHRDELMRALWGDEPPPSSERALSAVLSKLRASLERLEPAECTVCSEPGGAYRLRLPPAAWVDVEAAHGAFERALRALERRDPREAYGWALAAYTIARQELLPGEERPWLERKRAELHELLIHALDALIDIYTATGNYGLAVRFAEEGIAREPFHENGYRQLMRAHAAVGNGAQAILVYGRCRALLDEQLGAAPSPATEAVYLEILRSAGR